MQWRIEGERKAAESDSKTTYIVANREVRNCKEMEMEMDKKNVMEGLAQEVEEAACHQNLNGPRRQGVL